MASMSYSPQRSYRRDEMVGLGVAAAAHVALFAFLLLQPERDSTIEAPERMTVNLTEDIGLEAAAPIPVPESRAAIAPTLSDTPPVPREAAPPPVPTPERAVTQPRPSPPTERAVPQPRPAAPSQPRQTQRAEPRQQPRSQEGGASRIGNDFLAGAGASTTTQETRSPGQISGRAQASLLQGITREVKPHWQPPSGPDVEAIVSTVRFNLNPDGSLAGRPTVVRQTGINDTNRAQASRHSEQAIRAVQLAAPFDLPEEYYSAWKRVTLSFDWKLSQ
ncbi:energy transducer TonB [Qipengyuania atrilutea]|nr:energy transducer TonB [Actirhodobacter atriluteus]